MDGNQTSEGQPELPQPIQPGQTISPGTVLAATPSPAPIAEQVPVAQNEQVPPAPAVSDPISQQQPAPETAPPAPVSQESLQAPLANESVA